MAVSPSAHLPTTPNEHPVAAGHLGDRAEAAGAANEAVQPPDTTAELVCSNGMEKYQPSADDSSTQTYSAVPPTTPKAHPVSTRHLGCRVEAAAAALGAHLPPDTASEAATTLPPSPPSPEAIAVAPKAMATSSTAIPTALQPHGGSNAMVPAFMGPSQHVEEVLLGSQLHENEIYEIHDNNQYECPSISNCSAEKGDGGGTTERTIEMPSASKGDKLNTPKVSSG